MSEDVGSVASRRPRARLRRGATVACTFTQVNERLSISDGVRPVGGEVVAGFAYRTAAFAPILPARAPDADEIEALVCSPFRPEERIELLCVPERVTEVMQHLHEHCGSLRALRHACESAGLEHRLGEWLASVYEVSNYECPGPWVNPGGMPTVTRDPDGLVGLHVDNRERAVKGLRHRSRRRCCVNLGRASRYLLFINRSIDRVHADEHLVAGGACELSDVFLAANCNHPVVWLRVEPGEAYIAPTENLIHDASSLGSTSPDLTFATLGHFESKRRDAPSTYGHFRSTE